MPASDAVTRQKRQAILDSARSVFAAHGYEGASISAITKEAGVSKPTVYHHFPGKAALFGAYVAQECAAMLGEFLTDEMPYGDAAERLREIGHGMLNLLTSEVCLTIDRVVTSEAETFPELAEAFYAAGPQVAIDRLAAWLRQQAATGQFDIADAVLAAEQFFNLVQTRVVLQARLRLKPASTAEKRKVVDAAVTLFMRGYSPSLIRS